MVEIKTKSAIQMRGMVVRGGRREPVNGWLDPSISRLEDLRFYPL